MCGPMQGPGANPALPPTTGATPGAPAAATAAPTAGGPQAIILPTVRGTTVTVVKDAAGTLTLAPPTGNDEQVLVDGKVLKFDKTGKDVTSVAGGGSSVAGAAGTGAAALGGVAPGSLAAVLDSLVKTIQSLVAALGGVAGGGPTQAPPAKGGGLPALPGAGSAPTLTPQLQAAMAAGSSVAEAVTADGRTLTLVKDTAGTIRLLNPTGKPETVTIKTYGATPGERISFDAAGNRVG